MLSDTVVITFCGKEHEGLRQEFHSLYDKNFFDSVAYTTDWLKETNFYKENMAMFKYDKYFGFFLWKPYIILRTLDMFPEMKVLYCDSNLRFKDFGQFENSYNSQMQSQGAFFIEHMNFVNKDWTKRDTFILMDADNNDMWSGNQVWTPLMGFSQSKYGMIVKYLEYCQDPRIVTEMPNELGENLNGFVAHRWEQSVMSILAKKQGLVGVPDTVAMNWITKIYPQEIVDFRKEQDVSFSRQLPNP